MIANEIVQTEKQYLANLVVLDEVFHKPLRNPLIASQRLIDANECRVIFGTLEQLMALHNVLYDELERLRITWWPNQRFGPTFLQFADSLKIYTAYVNNYDYAVNEARRLEKSNEKFRKFLENGKKDPRSNKLTLEMLLIMPVQRLPRYQLLIADLVRNTLPTHVDHQALSQALSKIESVNLHVNQSKRDQEGSAKLAEIQAMIKTADMEPVDLMLPHRRFLKEFKFTFQASDTAFLFNDILV
jgi:FYVE/RhoGEF/PH domain-containing protein 5/6